MSEGGIASTVGSFCLPRARTTGSTMLEILLAYHAIWPLAMGAALGVLNAVPSVAEGETAGYRSSRIRLTRVRRTVDPLVLCHE